MQMIKVTQCKTESSMEGPRLHTVCIVMVIRQSSDQEGLEDLIEGNAVFLFPHGSCSECLFLK